MNYKLGLDLSLNGTGFSLIDDNNNLIIWGSIKQNKTSTEGQKLLHISSILEPLIKMCTSINIESIFAGPNIKTTIILAHVHGLIIYMCGVHNKPYQYFTPVAIKVNLLQKYPKKDINGIKIDSKQLVSQFIIKKYPILNPNIDNYDVTDAISIALCNN